MSARRTTTRAGSIGPRGTRPIQLRRDGRSICYNGTLWETDASGWRNSGPCSGTGGGICYQGTLWKYNGNWYSAGGCTHQTWNGCVTDRGSSSGPHADEYDRKVTAPSTSIRASLWPAEQYGSCPAQMKGLSYDWDAMNTLVDDLQADGNTNQPIGLVWAWQSLVGGGPLTAPAKDPNYIYNEVIVLMSDGLNTQNRWSRTQSNIDRRMYDGASAGVGTCDYIKNAGITIYTIHVNTGGDPKSTLLENCASGTDKFWMITAADQLGTVFKHDRHQHHQAARRQVTPAKEKARLNRRAFFTNNTQRYKRYRQSPAHALLGAGEDAFERLVGFLGEIGVQLTELGRFGDEAFVCRLGVLGLHFDRLVQRLDAEQLLEGGRTVLESLLRVVGELDRDRLAALRDRAEGLQGRFDVLFADRLQVFEILHHVSSLFPGCPSGSPSMVPATPVRMKIVHCTIKSRIILQCENYKKIRGIQVSFW